ncbi:MAG: DegT/DnrJ/EryC1/StrS family aminotransferase [Candidatus Rokubacteria bacterium]|nr:DegT/DnrJ/EryC1/StrS family aminotransferase [Candidatus Rokubacteria bacterium]
MAVPLLDLQAQYGAIEPEIMEALREVCARQQFILGPRVTELEERIAEYSGCRYGVGVSSGTDALLAALMALEVGPGDGVITTAFSFFATAGTIARLGARPLFVDIDPKTYNLSPAGVEDLIGTQCEMRAGRLIDRNTGGVVKVLMPVHLFGQMAAMDALMELARRHGLRVVEDAAQAIGAEYPGRRRAGSIGDIGCFSFFPSKNLGAFGDAGMCVTNDPTLAERLKILRVHGSRPRYHHLVVGGNFRLDELQAAVLLVKLKYLDGWTRRRQENARYYHTAFQKAGVGDHISTPRAMEGCRHIFNQYVVRAERRDDLKDHLTRAEVGSEIYYPVPLHLQRCFAHFGYGSAHCPEALRAARETLAIPIYPELTADQQRHVVSTVVEFYDDGH